MGHIRLGRIPKTRPWSHVFKILGGESIRADELARATAVAAERQLSASERDAAINYCFWILVRIVTAARGDDFAGELNRLGIRSKGVRSGVGFVQEVAQTVEKELRKRARPTVLARMAELSLREVLSSNIVDQSRSLFGTRFQEIHGACRAISTRKHFGQVAKAFFAQFLSRSIRYITDKELSNHVGADCPIGSPQQLLEFQQTLDRYCMESARIVEEFAAGWFSKQNWESNNDISEGAAAAFTAYALQKIQSELREGQR